MPKAPPKKPAFDFVISELESSKIWPRVIVKPMFGSHALYIDNRIMVIMRKKEGETAGIKGATIKIDGDESTRLVALDDGAFTGSDSVRYSTAAPF